MSVPVTETPIGAHGTARQRQRCARAGPRQALPQMPVRATVVDNTASQFSPAGGSSHTHTRRTIRTMGIHGFLGTEDDQSMIDHDHVEDGA